MIYIIIEYILLLSKSFLNLKLAQIHTILNLIFIL
jgi:hypothetical protein